MGAIRRDGEIRLHDTYVAVWEERVDEAAMQAVWQSVRAHLERRGFALGPVERVAQQLKATPRLRRDRKAEMAWRSTFIENYRHGRKGDLELEGDVSGRVVKVEFFQNVANVENSNGDQYDFRKFARMPRTLRLCCVVEMVALIRHLQSLGYTLCGDLREPLTPSVLRIAEGRAEDGLTPLERFNRTWGADRFTRGADGWPLPRECNGCFRDVNRDRDGVPIAPGSVRAVYCHRNRLVQGPIYPEMNGMWVLRLADGTFVTATNAEEYFTPTADMPRRRPLRKQQRVAKLDAAVLRALRSNDHRRAERVRGALAKLTSERMYYVLSLGHSKLRDGVLTWWGPNNGGYVFRLEHAGRYLESEILAHRSYYDNSERSRAIPCDVVEARARMVRDVNCTAVEQQPETARVVLYRHKGALERWQALTKPRAVPTAALTDAEAL